MKNLVILAPLLPLLAVWAGCSRSGDSAPPDGGGGAGHGFATDDAADAFVMISTEEGVRAEPQAERTSLARPLL